LFVGHNLAVTGKSLEKGGHSLSNNSKWSTKMFLLIKMGWFWPVMLRWVVRAGVENERIGKISGFFINQIAQKFDKN
jgi:hypothetical protein